MKNVKGKNNTTKVIGIVVGVIAFAVSAVVTSIVVRAALQRTTGDRPVAADVMTKPWVEQVLVASKVAIDVPGRLKSEPLNLPPELSQHLVNTTNLTRDADGLSVATTVITLKPGIPFDLNGAANGALANMKKNPNVKSMSTTTNTTKVLGLPGIEFQAEVKQKKGGSFKAYGVVFRQGNDVIQIFLAGRSDKQLDSAAWQRIKNSIRVPKGS
jgi:hypothetical protein